MADPVRCSITFESAKDMMASIEKFQRIVNGKVKDLNSGCVKQIVRIKNMFSINYKKSIVKKAKTIEEQTRLTQSMPLNAFKYCDIKFNVIIESNGQAIIGEIQL